MLKWHLKSFDELTIDELWNIYRNRICVFMTEKNMPANDVDETDKNAYHIWATNEDGAMVAYARFYEMDGNVSFGRVLTPLEFRGKGMGKQLLNQLLIQIQRYYPNRVIKIHSIADKETFYEQFGFTSRGEQFLEINIPHILMVKNP